MQYNLREKQSKCGEIMEQFLTAAEAAGRLRVNRQTVYRAIWAGKLRGVRVGRLWRIEEAALAKYLDGQAVK